MVMQPAMRYGSLTVMVDISHIPALGYICVVARRNAATLLPIIQNHVAPATIIHSDHGLRLAHFQRWLLMGLWTRICRNHNRGTYRGWRDAWACQLLGRVYVTRATWTGCQAGVQQHNLRHRRSISCFIAFIPVCIDCLSWSCDYVCISGCCIVYVSLYLARIRYS